MPLLVASVNRVWSAESQACAYIEVLQRDSRCRRYSDLGRCGQPDLI